MRPRRTCFRIRAGSIAAILVGASLVLLTPVATGWSAAAVNTWVAVTPSPDTYSDRAGATGKDGRIYVISGVVDYSTNPITYSTTVDVYKSGSDQWVTVSPIPTPHSHFAAAAGTDGRIYAIGGQNNSPTSTDGESRTNVVDVYDPTVDKWTSAAPLPTARLRLAAATDRQGRIYAIGGEVGTGCTNVVEAYTPTTNTWATMPPMSVPRCEPAATTGSDGRLYVMGGTPAGGQGGTSSVEAYDPATNRWGAIAPMLTGRAALSAVTAADGRIYAIGGAYLCCAQGTSTTVEVYGATTGRWSTAPALPSPRGFLVSGTGADGRIFAIDGYDGHSTVNTTFGYTPPPAATPTAAPSPSVASQSGTSASLAAPPSSTSTASSSMTSTTIESTAYSSTTAIRSAALGQGTSVNTRTVPLVIALVTLLLVLAGAGVSWLLWLRRRAR